MLIILKILFVILSILFLFTAILQSDISELEEADTNTTKKDEKVYFLVYLILSIIAFILSLISSLPQYIVVTSIFCFIISISISKMLSIFTKTTNIIRTIYNIVFGIILFLGFLFTIYKTFEFILDKLF